MFGKCNYTSVSAIIIFKGAEKLTWNYSDQSLHRVLKSAGYGGTEKQLRTNETRTLICLGDLQHAVQIILGKI